MSFAAAVVTPVNDESSFSGSGYNAGYDDCVYSVSHAGSLAALGFVERSLAVVEVLALNRLNTGNEVTGSSKEAFTLNIWGAGAVKFKV